MREQVKSLIRIVDRLDYKLDLLLRHSHCEGRVTVPLDEIGRGEIGIMGGRVKPSMNKDDVYF